MFPCRIFIPQEDVKASSSPMCDYGLLSMIESGLGIYYYGGHMHSKINSSTAIQLPIAGQVGRTISIVNGHLKTIAIIVVLALGGVLAFTWWNKPSSVAAYTTGLVSR